MNQPNCIHLPTLLKGQQARIYWSPCEGAEGYELERRIAPEGAEFPAGYESVYRGVGTPAEYAHRGLRWGEIHAYARSFRDIHESGNSWRKIATFGDSVLEEHVLWVDEVPEEADRAEYRVRAFGPGGVSDWRYSSIRDVYDHSPVDDEMEIEGSAGDLVQVAIVGHEVIRFPNSIHVRYDAGVLSLLDVMEDDIEVVGSTSGEVEFSYRHEIEDGTVWTGPMTALQFRLLRDGSTQIEMF